MPFDRSAIDRYRAGAGVPGALVAGLTAEELAARPGPGAWSLRELVMHLMDSDLVGSDRMKRVIAEENPTLLAYDQDAFARRLGYDRLDLGLACEIFRLNRLMTADLLAGLTDADFERAGMHTERGRETLEDLVHGYVEHLEYHARFAREKRERLGRGMPE
jgi:uncharacterized damage-inducible protein DinB